MNAIRSLDQILALAPDASSAKAGQGLAVSAKWLQLGANDRAVWGECKGSGKEPYRTAVDMDEPAFKCNCPSRKHPCKHGLGLLLLFAAQPALFPQGDPLPWAGEWLEKRDRREEEKQNRGAQKQEASPQEEGRKGKAKQKRAEEREAKVRAGVEELQLWMCDMVRQGLSGAPKFPAQHWRRMASRLVDAQAPGLARRVATMEALAGSGEGWDARLVAALGELQLILEAYSRIDALPEGIAADVRAEIGWSVKEEELLPQTGLRDRWIVLGQHVFKEGKLQVQRTWLHGTESDRPALLLNYAAGKKTFDAHYIPGTDFEAELVFYPASLPLRGVVKERLSPVRVVESPPPSSTIEELLQAYAKGVAVSPWLQTFPALIEGAIPVQTDEGMVVQDRTGTILPVDSSFRASWEFLALSGGHPFPLFGEWDGERFLPLTLWAADRCIVLNNSLGVGKKK